MKTEEDALAAEPARKVRWRRWAVRLALGLVVFFAVVELLARANIRHEQRKRAYLGDRLYTRVVGSRGTPIVFIAGLQGSTRYWGRAFDVLATDHRVIYVDLLGFGRSPWPDSEYTLDDQLGAVRRTLVDLGATRDVIIVAHSFGSIIASYYAERHPGEIQRLYLLGAPVYANAEEARTRIREMSPIAAMFSLQPFLARESCLIMGAARPVLRKIAPLFSKRHPDAVAEDAVLHSWPSIRGAINEVLLTRPIELPLRKVGKKTLLIHGTRDTVTSVARMRGVAQESGAELMIIDSDHQDYTRGALPIILRAIRNHPR